MVGEVRRSPRKHKSHDWRRSESRSRSRKSLNENEKVDRDRSRRRNREKQEKKIEKNTDGKNNFDSRRKISENRSMQKPRKERTPSPHEKQRDSSVERLFRKYSEKYYEGDLKNALDWTSDSFDVMAFIYRNRL